MPANAPPVNQSTDVTPSGGASSQAVFDASVLGAMFGDEPVLITRVLQTFVSSTHTSLAELVQAMAAQDLAAITALAHKVAGASRMSGALALGYCAHNLEQAAKRRDAAVLPQAIADLQAQWELTQTAIAAQIALP